VNWKLKTGNLKLPVADHESSPPFFKSWRRLYFVVLGELVVLVVLFYLFMKAFG